MFYLMQVQFKPRASPNKKSKIIRINFGFFIFEEGVNIIAALAAESQFLKSNGEARRALKENSISVNKAKVQETYKITSQDLINERYVLLQRGKKTYFILNFV